MHAKQFLAVIICCDVYRKVKNYTSTYAAFVVNELIVVAKERNIDQQLIWFAGYYELAIPVKTGENLQSFGLTNVVYACL
jgi:hypothetical protein